MKPRLRHYARGNLLSCSEELEKSLRLARGDKHRFEHIEGLYDELALSHPVWADIYCLPGCHRLRFAVNVELRCHRFAGTMQCRHGGHDGPQHVY